ncbi:phenylalanine--tRNA ligase subunit beta [Demequina sp. SYSU T00192]|uniref:Phenylalanine--tRNA ligase beta subunit n=1 Tax=Demequina litoralis TaxID=3051660 RepID=A0ABT8GB76_9MICO|nr:phenylalanine--tRNA ligase subunit beta [Demequina sp. SYSU T00192]MDN4476229.1 phenylalanine--tRNA ligase subunit beta [Demequina sp. SYSU T00192]
MPKIPLSWLAESVALVPDATPVDIATSLARVGLEEEGIHGSGVEGPLVVGRVMSLVKEEQSNGKTINYCRVDVGSYNDPEGPGHKPDHKVEYPSSKGIVCGAHNFVEGDWVVVVLPGATLPGPFPISGRKTYGHWSDGMICSSKELGLGDDHSGIIVLTEMGFDASELEPGQDAIALLGLDEKTIEINVTPDRGYSFSIRGVAREYGHATGASFTDPAGLPVSGEVGEGFPILIEDEAPVRGNVGCDRFVARIVRGFDPSASSPTWMRTRLEAAGMRSISLAVDVTNYVMLELGQPLHAYDLATLTAPIVVRRARPAESIVTLDDATRVLHGEDLLITDSLGGHAERAIGIAGVMGGALTEVSESTTDVLLEGAHFDPISVARTARRHKLGSEASRRFERAVDTALPPVAVQRAANLLVELGGGVIEEVYTDVDNVPAVEPIEMDWDFPARIVGVPYTAEQVIDALEQVGCLVERDGEVLIITRPTWRADLEGPINLVEEVARLQGYEGLPSVLPVAPPGRGYTHSQLVRKSVARSLAEAGLTQVLTYPFISEARLDEVMLPADDVRRDVIRLANPLSAEQPLLRTAILETLVDAVKVNLGRGAQDVALYETGRAYLGRLVGAIPATYSGTSITPDDVLALNEAIPGQVRRVAGVMAGNRVTAGWDGHATPWRWTDAMAMVEKVERACGVVLEISNEAGERQSTAPFHPGRVAVYRLEGQIVGVAGEVHPKVCENLGLPARTVAFELLLDPLIDESEGVLVTASPVSGQVLAKEDFAFVVSSDVAAGSLVDAVIEAGDGLVEDARVFDVYTGEQIGEGKKSLAINVRMRDADHTLSADEVLLVREAIIAAAGEKFGAVLR